MKFRKKPVIVDAIQYHKGINENEITEFTETRAFPFGEGMEIPTLEGNHMASDGDWIIRGVHGEFYPCKPDIFEKTYEKVENILPLFFK